MSFVQRRKFLWICFLSGLILLGLTAAFANATTLARLNFNDLAQQSSAVARLRPRRPIVALTHNQWAVQQMALEWGVIPLLVKEAQDVEDLWELSIGAARDAGLIASGDRIVMTAGTSVNIPGTTNVIKVDVA